MQNVALAFGSLPWGVAAAESETPKLSAFGEKARVCVLLGLTKTRLAVPCVS